MEAFSLILRDQTLNPKVPIQPAKIGFSAGVQLKKMFKEGDLSCT